MPRSPFLPRHEDLAVTIPVFPLPGVLLLPGGLLPLNIFEPRYLAMVDDALSSDRLIGMVQPSEETGSDRPPPVYDVGCAGRITSYDETDDGRYLITLTGVSRFRVSKELPTTRGYRRVQSDWSPFRDDCNDEAPIRIDRGRLRAGLMPFFKSHGIEANWDAVDNTPDGKLVTTLAMICPFEANEKQALLEASDAAARAETLMSLIEMANLSNGTEERRH